MGTDSAGLEGTAPGASAGPPDGSGDRLISLPGRSPVLDAAQLGVLRGTAANETWLLVMCCSPMATRPTT
jgi:hypothetical protein